MKTITIILLFFVYAANAQVKVNEVKMKFGSEFHKAKDPDVVFPVISTDNKVVDDKINLYAIKQLTGDDSCTNISTTLFRAMNEGLSELDYEITLNTKDILSYRFDALGCGAYCEPYSIYLNFDLHTGEVLGIRDIISDQMLDSFRIIVLADKTKGLKADLREIRSLLASGKIDSADFNFVSEHIQQCMGDVSTDRFLLFKNEVQIIDACEFPHVVKALQPVFELRYPFKKIKKMIQPSFAAKVHMSPP